LQDFGALYDRLETLTDVEPSDLVSGDEVITRGNVGAL
jgi:hypothetical protein